jgi:hypothetical protein
VVEVQARWKVSLCVAAATTTADAAVITAAAAAAAAAGAVSSCAEGDWLHGCEGQAEQRACSRTGALLERWVMSGFGGE